MKTLKTLALTLLGVLQLGTAPGANLNPIAGDTGEVFRIDHPNGQPTFVFRAREPVTVAITTDPRPEYEIIGPRTESGLRLVRRYETHPSQTFLFTRETELER